MTPTCLHQTPSGESTRAHEQRERREAREDTVGGAQYLAGQWGLGLDLLTRHGHMSWLTRGTREAQHAAYTACEHEWRRECESGMYGQRGTCATSAGMTSDSTPVIKTTTSFYPLSKGP